ncbi:MAG: cytochrome P450 [Acidobacteria bacterium]|nr:cytochrome P450 [Acidobacteriota bacterium]
MSDVRRDPAGADDPADWDPHAAEVLADQRAAYDAMRSRCPVARDAAGGWTLFRHADILRVIHNHAGFSNVVSRHLSVPNGMDPPVHATYRRLIEPYFDRDIVSAFEPGCRQMAAELVDDACVRQNVDLIADLALPFAARAQCGYLGWPMDLAPPLIDWTIRNHDATLRSDRRALDGIARELETLVADVVASRQERRDSAPVDLTDRLIRETVEGRPLSLEELTSILRNWTMGEVGTLAASVGIVAHALATNIDLQYQLRRHLQLLPDAIDELLRIHGPLVSNRRTVTHAVDLGGRHLEAGDQVTLNWIAANRDPAVFEQPDTFRLDRDPASNLLYGAGIHVCPGARLARLELRIVLEELLAATLQIEPREGAPPTLAAPPASGYATLPVHIIAAG